MDLRRVVLGDSIPLGEQGQNGSLVQNPHPKLIYHENSRELTRIALAETTGLVFGTPFGFVLGTLVFIAELVFGARLRLGTDLVLGTGLGFRR